MDEEYTDVKFKTMFLGSRFDEADSRKRIIEISKILSEKGLVKNNVGNISERVKSGMVITPSGYDLGSLKEEYVALVVGYLEKPRIVKVIGKRQPSSESVMHWLIYREFPKVNAVVHVHPKVLDDKKIPKTSNELPYGTVELAKEVVKTLKKSKRRVIVLKNHGVVCIGKSLEDCKKVTFKRMKL